MRTKKVSVSSLFSGRTFMHDGELHMLTNSTSADGKKIAVNLVGGESCWLANTVKVEPTEVVFGKEVNMPERNNLTLVELL